MPHVRAVVVVDLRRHVDDAGRLNEQAETETWRVLADLTPGRDVRVEIGDAAWTSERLRWLLTEYLREAGSVVIEGTRGTAVDSLASLLRAEQGRTAC